MAALRQRATDTESYSGEFSTGWTSGAVTGGINDSAERQKVRRPPRAAASLPALR